MPWQKNCNRVWAGLINLKPSYWAVLCLFALAIWGWGRAPVVGLSWDEPYQRLYGEVVYTYLMEGDPALHTDSERLYGPLVPFVLTLAERVSGTLSDRDAYVLRHRLTWLIFVAGAGVFFLIARDLFGSPYWGLFAMLSLILSPSLSSHGFFNTKDIPFMVGCMITVYLGIKAVTNPTAWAIAVLALATGLTTDIRVLGILFVPIFCFFWGKNLHRQGLFLSIYALTVYLFWPSLWAAPWVVFGEALTAMRQYPWGGTVMYLGFFEPADHLPWHYLPVYMGVSTPLVYLLGLVACVLRFFFKQKEDKPLWVGLFWVLFPMVLVIGGGAVLYDSWRHVFFVYSGIVLLSTYGWRLLYTRLRDLDVGRRLEIHKLLGLSWRLGLRRLWGIRGLFMGSTGRKPFHFEPHKIKIIFMIFILCSWIPLAWFIWKEAPLSYVYFNALAGDRTTIYRRFETDYWGLSYREGLEWLASQHPSPKTIWMPHFPGQQSLALLTTAEQQKLQWVEDPAQADYIVTTFRWVTGLPPYPPQYEKRVREIPVLRVYKMR